MFVRAAEGRRVRHPDSLALLREEGEDVPDTEYWFRRLSEGDVEIAETAQPFAAEVEPPKAEDDAPDEDPVAAEPVEHTPNEGDPE